MIGFILGILLMAFLIPYGIGTGQIGAAVIGAVVGYILIVLGKAGRDNAKAYGNFVDYWAKGGPEQYRRRRNGL